MDEKIYAPVIVTTLFRFVKFKRCIESLSRCTGATQTELFIGVDYPANDSHWAGYRKICEYLPSISGFKEVNIFKRQENWGQSKNTRDLVNQIRGKYDRYIMTEDDNEFSPNFLEYMNQCLEKYQFDPNVVLVCGYSYDDWELNTYSSNAFPMQGYSAWGTGKWFSKRDEYVNSGFPQIDGIINNDELVKKLFKKKMYIPVHQMMYRTKKHISGSDVRLRCYCALYNKYCIFPSISKVRNWGFDNESTNCLTIDAYSTQKIDESPSFVLDDFVIGHYLEIDKIHDKHYAGNSFFRLMTRLEYFFWCRTGREFTDNMIYRFFVKLRIRILGK